MTPVEFEKLGELYTGVLASDAYFRGAAGSIADAVLCATDFKTPDSPGKYKLEIIDAAAKLARDAMGLLQTCNSTLDRDWLDSRRDWNRIDEFWGNCHVVGTYEGWPPEEQAVEASWVHKELTAATTQVWDDYEQHCQADWAHDLVTAAGFLGAAALLVSESFDIKEVSRG